MGDDNSKNSIHKAREMDNGTPATDSQKQIVNSSTYTKLNYTNDVNKELGWDNLAAMESIKRVEKKLKFLGIVFVVMTIGLFIYIYVRIFA